MSENLLNTVTIVEQTIRGGKVLSWARGDDAGSTIIDTAERQQAHWDDCKLDRVTVLDLAQVPKDSLFSLPAGGISNAGRLEDLKSKNCT